MFRRFLPFALACFAPLVGCDTTSAAQPDAKSAAVAPTSIVEAKPTITKPAEAKPAETKPAETTPEVPLVRPRSIDAARERLIAIAKSGELSGLAALADPSGRLEHTHKDKRVWRTLLRAEDPQRLADAFVTAAPDQPIRRVTSITDAASDAARDKAFRAKALTVEYRPGGAAWVDFVFETVGEELVLVRITT